MSIRGRSARSAGIIAFAGAIALAAVEVSAGALSLDARLIEAASAAREGSATIQVNVSGLEIVDPSAVQEKPRNGQGHLHYRVDDGPIIATTITKLSFHGLSAGMHHISVALVGNDHQPLGLVKELEVSVPERIAERAALRIRHE